MTDDDGIVALLTEQRDLYARLDGLADRQRLLISGDEPEDLLAVLGERQTVLDRLGVLAADMRPYQQSWRDVRGRLSGEEGARADRLILEVNCLLAGILEKDEADARLLAARKHAAAQAMGDLKKSRAAGAAYAASAQSATGQVDWTDE
jgi:hypothetical protein